jgi:hypothetical protein
MESNSQENSSASISEALSSLASRMEAQTEWSRWTELLSAFLLSAAVVLSAFGAWQATKWGGQQSILFAEASSARLTSSNYLALGLTEISYDTSIWADAILALANGDQSTIDTFRERVFSDDFKVAFDAWIAQDPFNNPDAPQTPFDVPEYKPVGIQLWTAVGEGAEEKFSEGKSASDNSDDYILSTVFFASVLFFAGITTKFRDDRLRTVVVLMAVGLFIGGAVWLASLRRLGI